MKSRSIQFEKYFNRKTFFLYYFLILSGLIISLFLGSELSYYLIIVQLGFGYNLIIFRENISLLSSFLLSWFTGTAILIAFSSITNIVSLPINTISIVIFLLVFLLIFYFKKNEIYRIPKIKFFDKFDLLILFISIVSIIAKVISISEYSAPIFHDPIAHAEWAKIIVTTGHADYFYSPGLHYLAAIGEIIGSYDVPKQILLITNIFNALLGIPVYIFLRLLTKENWWAVIAAFLFNLGPYPMTFYLNAGKNALIITIGYIFIILSVIHLINKKNYKEFLIFLNLFVIAMISSHYPIAIIGSIFIGPFLIFNLRKKWYLLGLSIGYIVGGVWTILKYFQEDIETRFALSNTQTSKIEISIYQIYQFFLSFWKQAIAYIQARDVGNFVLVLGIIGLLVLILSYFSSKKSRWVFWGGVLYIIVLYTTGVIFYSKLGLIFRTQIIFSFALFYLSSSFVLGVIIIPYIQKHIKYFDYILLMLLIGSSIYTSNTIFIDYQKKQETRNMVSSNDLVVFDWIENHINSDDVILNNGVKNDINSDIIFQTDSGAWITAFTSKKIAIPFSEKSTSLSSDNYLMQQELIADPGNCEALRYFLENGVFYYFKPDRTIFGEQIVVSDNMVEKDVYSLVFESGGSKIYRINGCK